MKAARDLRVWSAGLLIAFALSLTLNVVNALEYRRFAARRLARLASLGSSVDALVGVTRAGNAVSSANAPCTVLRYSSGSCGFCKKDVPAFRRLVDQLGARSCAVFVVPPTAADRPPEESILPPDGLYVTTPYIDVRFARQTRFSATPTVVLLRGTHVVWSKVGILAEADISSAVAALSR
jgi:protein-disulfide isomerase